MGEIISFAVSIAVVALVAVLLIAIVPFSLGSILLLVIYGIQRLIEKYIYDDN